MKKLITILVFLLLAKSIYANNILVSNVALLDQDLTAQTCKIKFDVSWDNSWRNNTIPGNWDAAWIFIKARVNGGVWQHVTLENNGITVPSGASISIPTDRKGLFIYRSSDGNGNVNFTNCSVFWDYGFVNIPNDASIELKVFAIEMVYIPQGSFKAGDGSAQDGVFKQGTSDNDPWYILDEASITTTNSIDNGYYYKQPTENTLGPNYNYHGSLNGEIFTIPSYFPKGYNAVYCMKYEITQQQYADFLSTLKYNQIEFRINTNFTSRPLTNKFVMSNTNIPSYRSSITCNENAQFDRPVDFFCDLNNNGIPNENDDGQNIPCRYLSWPHLAAYLDWSALRPMTELEFEKICRGFNEAVIAEFAWGGAESCMEPYIISNQGTADESISNLSYTYGNMCFVGTSRQNIGGQIIFNGPFRSGIFAASSSTPNRMITGATFFGVMEMSGNLWEQCVCVGNSAGRAFSGLHGDGKLDNGGNADVDYWPGINGNNDNAVANIVNNSGVTDRAGIGMRGGHEGSNYFDCTTSCRLYANSDVEQSTSAVRGGRGVRTAP